MPLKDGQTAFGTDCLDKSTDDSPLKMQSGAEKRNLIYRCKESCQKTEVLETEKSAKTFTLNAWQQQTDEYTVLEEETVIQSEQSCSSGVFEKVEDHISSRLDTDLAESNSDLTN